MSDYIRGLVITHLITWQFICPRNIVEVCDDVVNLLQDISVWFSNNLAGTMIFQDCDI